MNKLFLAAIILLFGCTSAFADGYMNDPIPANAGQTPIGITRTGDGYSMWNNSTQTYKTYNVKGNQIYGSDGSSYTRYGDTIQSNSSRPKSYYFQNNIPKPLY